MKRVGVIGGGQLAWMMAEAGKGLGIDLVVQTPQSTDPAVSLAKDAVFAAIDDVVATAELATRCEVIAFENEFVDIPALEVLAHQGVCFRPHLSVLVPLLDKYDQRSFLQQIGLPTPNFEDVTPESWDKWLNDASEASFPLVLKARRHGYDGQGTFIIKDRVALTKLQDKVKSTPLLVEEYIPFERELAAIAARSVTGDVVIYPIVETQQENQVCRRVFAPAQIDERLVKEVEAIATHLLNSLKAVGVFGIELFLTQDNRILVNEIAPRTHNSGHFTIEACETSQFAQHLLAVCGLPLGNPRLKTSGAVMINLLGFEETDSDYAEKRSKIAEIPQAYLHWYGKTQSRPGRKLGHVTILLDTPDREAAERVAARVESIWYGS
ncbi:5-(carboxyamino)imidazole ribonucleotide synthase [Merismopedia glauca]|uniref:N5-carboxyaminoimidazole ribonucleotide synthase n=1 Tax=Merismopedia glauca CCAP 1448/3 TaxID=1296344 RepID=A0A2T1CA58_9CYAN|nr:5-(carboxyamino)imidazole ribonucleotide synthase [Merismopedia glauca]PSB05048.1 5-(carboxyamino)imidazole ribonucleotide synthase [Merismopedia glauca CCAP 1448/3]